MTPQHPAVILRGSPAPLCNLTQDISLQLKASESSRRTHSQLLAVRTELSVLEGDLGSAFILPSIYPPTHPSFPSSIRQMVNEHLLCAGPSVSRERNVPLVREPKADKEEGHVNRDRSSLCSNLFFQEPPGPGSDDALPQEPREMTRRHPSTGPRGLTSPTRPRWQRRRHLNRPRLISPAPHLCVSTLNLAHLFHSEPCQEAFVSTGK